jgi:cytochrome c
LAIASWSSALKALQLIWSPTQLDKRLSNPNKLVPGNKMVVQLANDAQDRAHIIAYLVIATAPRDNGQHAQAR